MSEEAPLWRTSSTVHGTKGLGRLKQAMPERERTVSRRSQVLPLPPPPWLSASPSAAPGHDDPLAAAPPPRRLLEKSPPPIPADEPPLERPRRSGRPDPNDSPRLSVVQFVATEWCLSHDRVRTPAGDPCVCVQKCDVKCVQ